MIIPWEASAFLKQQKIFYILGLWLADGYWRSSSIGLTSVTPALLERFTIFLRRVAPSYPLKKRVYQVDGRHKRKQVAVQVYVNSRLLTRLFMELKIGVLPVPTNYISAYLAGRIDGDGHVDTKHRTGIRIAYSSKEDALRDQGLLGKTNVSLYQYEAAKTFVLYLTKHYREQVLKDLQKFSVKLAP